MQEPPSAPQFPVHDFLQVAALNGTDHCLTLAGERANGRIELRRGQVVHAEYGDLIGEEAIYSALTDPALVARQAPGGGAEPGRSIFTSTPHLLIEAARRADEGLVRLPARREPQARSVSGPAPSSVAVGPLTHLHSKLALVVGILMVALVVGWAVLVSPKSHDRDASTASGAVSQVSSIPEELVFDVSSSDVTPPRLLGPSAAPRPDVNLAVTPTIVVRALVDRDGKARKTQLYRSRLELAAFEDAALSFVSGARFAPATKHGVPVSVWINHPVTFTSVPESTEPIAIAGSDTIGAALAPALGQLFTQKSGVPVRIQSLGSASAFTSLFDGSAQIGAASRAINQKELSEAETLGLELTEFVLGYDGVAVVVHPSNPRVSATLAELAALFGEPTAGEPGSSGERLHLYGRPAYSGTHDFFLAKVVNLGEDAGSRKFAPQTTIMEKSEELVARVANDPAGLGYVGLGHANSSVKTLAIAAGTGTQPVLPQSNTIRAGTYPIYRPLLLYTRGHPHGVVAQFLRFALGPEGQKLVTTHGFVQSDVPYELRLLDESGAASVAPEVVRIRFGTASHDLDGVARTTLSALVSKVKSGASDLVVVGNADARGATENNSDLAVRRAREVAGYLKKQGVHEHRVTVRSRAAGAPVESNQSEEGRAKNRRVDIYVIERR